MTPTSRKQRIFFLLGLLLITAVCLVCAVAAHSQGIYSCQSIGASMHKDWKPLYAAPHNGTIVEILNTYEIAPTYGLFKWSTAWYKNGSWVGVDRPDQGIMGDECNFYRPFMGDPTKYVDPTHGAQYHEEYWCKAMRRQKEDKCE